MSAYVFRRRFEKGNRTCVCMNIFVEPRCGVFVLVVAVCLEFGFLQRITRQEKESTLQARTSEAPSKKSTSHE